MEISFEDKNKIIIEQVMGGGGVGQKSDCTYVHADIAPESPQNKVMVTNDRKSVNRFPYDKFYILPI